jgi:hypothetical protein
MKATLAIMFAAIAFSVPAVNHAHAVAGCTIRGNTLSTSPPTSPRPTRPTALLSAPCGPAAGGLTERMARISSNLACANECNWFGSAMAVTNMRASKGGPPHDLRKTRHEHPLRPAS